jgi:TRAP-type mannitol/chloroaromatic compound transport system substrate-binding protein
MRRRDSKSALQGGGARGAKTEKMRASVLIGLAVWLLLAPPQARADTVTLVTPLAYGTHLPGLGTGAATLAKLIKERSGGSLALDLKQPGDGTKPQEILDKVSSGAVDAGFATASYWSAKLPAAALFAGFPFGPDGKTYFDWFEQGSGRKLYQEMYDHAGLKLHVMPCAFGGAETGGWFAKEIKTSEDLKGLRMRMFGRGGRVMSRLGATTVVVAGSDLAAAFAKGKTDAAELYPPAVDVETPLKDKVKLIYQPGWHQPETVLELIVNKDRWDGLTDRDRGLIEGACRDTLQMTLGSSAQLQADALATLAKAGVRIENFPEAVMASLRQSWNEVAKDEGDQDYFFRAVLDDIDKFRAKPTGTPAPPPSVSAEPNAAAETKAVP